MTRTSPSDGPRYEIRRLSNDRYVIDALFPAGTVEQLLGVFVSHEHAKRWLASFAGIGHLGGATILSGRHRIHVAIDTHPPTH